MCVCSCVLIQLLAVELELQHVSRLLLLQLSVLGMFVLGVVQDLLLQLETLLGPVKTRHTQQG